MRVFKSKCSIACRNFFHFQKAEGVEILPKQDGQSRGEDNSYAAAHNTQVQCQQGPISAFTPVVLSPLAENKILRPIQVRVSIIMYV